MPAQRRPCRPRAWAPYAFADAQHGDARTDELQSGHRRDRQGPSGQGDRRAGRRHGAGGRRSRHPVPHLEREQGPGGARHPRAGGSSAVQARDTPHAGEPAQSVAVPAGGRRPAHRRRTRRRAASPGAASNFGPAASCSPWARFSAAGSTSDWKAHPGGRAGDPPAQSRWRRACAIWSCASAA